MTLSNERLDGRFESAIGRLDRERARIIREAGARELSPEQTRRLAEIDQQEIQLLLSPKGPSFLTWILQSLGLSRTRP